MSSIPLKSFQPPAFGVDLLSRAASLLTAEATRLQPMRPEARPSDRSGVLALKPVDALRNAAETAAEQGAMPRSSLSAQPEAASRPLEADPTAPATDLIATVLASDKVDELRRRSAELLETLLAALAQGKGASASSYEDRVPLIRATAPVRAGTSASATIRVTNEEHTASEVSFYATNFVADSGYEMPSLLVSVAPRVATVPAGGEVAFEIQVSVPAQAPSGCYSGLVQATGCKYVKAVVMFEVL